MRSGARATLFATKVEDTIVKRTIIFLIAALALFACKQKSEVSTPAADVQAAAAAPAATTASLPPGHPAIGTAAPAAAAQPGAAPAAASAANVLSGTVIEMLDAPGYTYVHVKTASGQEWAAVPATTIKKGSTVNIAVQMPMENFESKTLKRKFDRILFGTVAGGGAAPPSMPPPQMMTSAAADPGDVNVSRADGGKTIAEVWAQKSTLKDAPIVVRGKVVKFLPAIMGKNWLHLRDGSGSAKAGDNDLAVTTGDTVKVGDVVTVKGTLHTDKDFGAGYSYAVIIEDGAIVK
jgi:hypothetical protein